MMEKLSKILQAMCPLIQNVKQWGGEFANIIMQRVKKNWSRSSSLAVEPSLGRLNTRLHGSPLLGVDFPVDCETGRSPSSLRQSPSPSSLPDLLGHPGGGRAVSHVSDDGLGVAVKNSTKPVIVDIDEASQIQITTLLSGDFHPGPHVGLEVGETYGLKVKVQGF